MLTDNKRFELCLNDVELCQIKTKHVLQNFFEIALVKHKEIVCS